MQGLALGRHTSLAATRGTSSITYVTSHAWQGTGWVGGCAYCLWQPVHTSLHK
jgi:hypothetical protein